MNQKSILFSLLRTLRIVYFDRFNKCRCFSVQHSHSHWKSEIEGLRLCSLAFMFGNRSPNSYKCTSKSQHSVLLNQPTMPMILNRPTNHVVVDLKPFTLLMLIVHHDGSIWWPSAQTKIHDPLEEFTYMNFVNINRIEWALYLWKLY